MHFKITQIELDFSDDTDDEPLNLQAQNDIYDELIGSIWEADDGDDLIEEITCAHGWCVKSIDYVHILN